MTHSEAIKTIFIDYKELLDFFGEDWDKALENLQNLKFYRQHLKYIDNYPEPLKSFLQGYILHFLDVGTKWRMAVKDVEKYKHIMRLGDSIFNDNHNIGVTVDTAKNVEIRAIAEQYGAINRAGMMKCPLHEDKSPSLKIYDKTNSWYCFSCNQGGDVIQFIRLMEDCGFYTAVKILAKGGEK